MPIEAQGVVGIGARDQWIQTLQEARGFLGLVGFAGVFDEEPDRDPEAILRDLSVALRGFDDFGRVIPKLGVTRGGQRGKHPLVESGGREVGAFGFILDGGVGFFGERIVGGQEETIGGDGA